MKRYFFIFYFLFSFFCFFSFVNGVNAQEIFKNNVNIFYEVDQSLFNAIKTSDGYVVVTHNNYTDLVVRKSDLKGNEVWTKEIKSEESFDMEKNIYTYNIDDEKFIIFTPNFYIIMKNDGTIVEKNNISAYNVSLYEKYFYLENDKSNTSVLEKRNQNMKIVKSYDLSLKYVGKTNVSNDIKGLGVSDDVIYVLEYFSYTNDDSSIVSGYKIDEFDLNLNLQKEILINDSSNIAGENTNLIKIGENYYYGFFGLYKISSDGNIEKLELGSDSSSNLYDYSDIRIVNGYIVTTGFYGVPEKNGVLLEIYDQNFNLIQSIDVSSDLKRSTDDSFQLGKKILSTSDGFLITGKISYYNEADLYEVFVAEYILKHKIITKTDGNGTITSSQNEAYQGEGVTFRIIPNEGYILDFVKVTDASGNVVTFTSNTFTMPSADVIIEAVFRKVVNPVTATNTIMIVLVVMIIVVCTIIVYDMRSKEKLKY